MVVLGRPIACYLGRPRHSQLGVATSVIASIIQGAVTVTMATVQIIYQEIQEQRARRQWRHDQARQSEQLRQQVDSLTQQNQDLQNYLNSIVSGDTPGAANGILPSAGTILAAPWLPYVAIGGGVLLLILLLKRRQK